MTALLYKIIKKYFLALYIYLYNINTVCKLYICDIDSISYYT